MKKNEQGIPVVNRKELDLILKRLKEKQSDKGVVLMGKPGVGKTTFMRWWEGSENPMAPNDYMITSNKLVTMFMLKGMEAFVNQQSRLMFPVNRIDDLGTEIIASNYGNKIDIIPHLLQLAYEAGHRFEFYTTNLNYKELTERYGPRIIDRLQEKCYFFILEDTHLRELATAETINKHLK